MLLSRPYSNVPNTKNFQKYNLHFDKSLAEVISEDLDGRTPLWHAISSADEVEVKRLLNADNIRHYIHKLGLKIASYEIWKQACNEFKYADCHKHAYADYHR